MTTELIKRLEEATEGVFNSRAPKALELGVDLYRALMTHSDPIGETFGGLPVRQSPIMPNNMGILICVNGDHIIIDGRSDQEREADALKAKDQS